MRQTINRFFDGGFNNRQKDGGMIKDPNSRVYQLHKISSQCQCAENRPQLKLPTFGRDPVGRKLQFYARSGLPN